MGDECAEERVQGAEGVEHACGYEVVPIREKKY